MMPLFWFRFLALERAAGRKGLMDGMQWPEQQGAIEPRACRWRLLDF